MSVLPKTLRTTATMMISSMSPVRSMNTRSGSKVTFSPVVISGPSGSGKSTLVKRLMNEFTGCFALTVSHTTRKPRPGEQNGREYYFVSREEFLSAVSSNSFIEHAEFSGNLYGTSKKAIGDVINSGRICILDLELQGVKSIKVVSSIAARFVFVKTPNLEELKKRLEGRGTENAVSLARRLEAAKSALEYAAEPGAYDLTIENTDLDVAYEQLKNFLHLDIKEVQRHQKEIDRIS